MALLPINPSPCIPGVGEGGRLGTAWEGGGSIGFGLDGRGGADGSGRDGLNGLGGGSGLDGTNGANAIAQKALDGVGALAKALQTLAQGASQNFQLLARGNETVKRFRLTETLTAGSSALCDIIAKDGSGASIDSGQVFDINPGGWWEGVADDEGWCTAIDGTSGQYAIIRMESDTQFANLVTDAISVDFVNGSGEAIPSHAVMRITNWSAASGRRIYNVAKPDSTYRWRYLVNNFGTVAIGANGKGRFLSEGGLVYINSGTPALNEIWRPTASQWYLTQHGPGFLVNGAGTATSGGVTVIDAAQVIGGEVRVFNDSGGAVAAGASATMSVYGGSTGTTDTSLDVTVFNRSTTSWATSKYGACSIDMGGNITGVPFQT